MPGTISTAAITQHIINGELYYGATAPGSFVAMTHTAGVPTGSTHLGTLSGVTTCTLTSTVSTVPVEQSLTPIAPYVSQQMAKIEASLLELTYANLLRVLTQGTGATGGSVNRIGVGGQLSVTPITVCVVGKLMGVTPAQYVICTLYSAMQTQPAAFDIVAGKERVVKLTFEGLTDPTRTLGDQQAQFVEGTL